MAALWAQSLLSQHGLQAVTAGFRRHWGPRRVPRVVSMVAYFPRVLRPSRCTPRGVWPGVPPGAAASLPRPHF